MQDPLTPQPDIHYEFHIDDVTITFSKQAMTLKNTYNQIWLSDRAVRKLLRLLKRNDAGEFGVAPTEEELPF